MEASIILVNFNTKDLLQVAIESVLKWTKGVRYELLIVDNNSSDGSQGYLKKLSKKNKKVKIIQSEANLGFAGGNNLGIKTARGKYILLLNSDTKIYSNVIGEMVARLQEKRYSRIGIASCMLKNEDGSVQGNGGYFPSLTTIFSWMFIQDFPLIGNLFKPFHPLQSRSFSKNENFYAKERELDWLTGAFLMVRREVFDKIGLLDDGYFMYVEDVDFCFRAKIIGWKVLYFPNWSILHVGGGSGRQGGAILGEYEGIKRYYRKFHPAWQYFILRFFLKLGALGRMAVFGIIDGRSGFELYVKAFRQA